MASKKEMQEKIKSWKRTFKINWKLFRQSTIGVVGLGIILAFFFIAIVSPFLNLRDPVSWVAPDTDIVEVKRAWNYSTGGTVSNASVVFEKSRAIGDKEDILYVSTLQGELQSLSLNTADRNWIYNAGRPIDRTPAVKNDIVYLVSSDADEGHLTVISDEGDNYNVLWAYQNETPLTTTPLVHETKNVSESSGAFNRSVDVVFVGSEGGYLFAFVADPDDDKDNLFNEDQFGDAAGDGGAPGVNGQDDDGDGDADFADADVIAADYDLDGNLLGGKDGVYGEVIAEPEYNGTVDTPLAGDDVYAGTINASSYGIQPGEVLIRAGSDGVLQSVPQGGEVISQDFLGNDVIIEPEYSGTVDTTAQGDDVQEIAVGTTDIQPGDIIISSGPNGVLDTQPAGNEVNYTDDGLDDIVLASWDDDEDGSIDEDPMYGVVEPSGATYDMIWNISVNGSIYTTPVFFNNSVCIGTTEGVFYCFSASDGTELWNISIGDPITTDPALDDMLEKIVITAGPTLYAVNYEDIGSDGKPTLDSVTLAEGTSDYPEGTLSSPAVVRNSGTVYVTASDYDAAGAKGSVYSIRLNDLSIKWAARSRAEFGFAPFSQAAPKYYDGWNKLYVGTTDGRLYAIGTQAGEGATAEGEEGGEGDGENRANVSWSMQLDSAITTTPQISEDHDIPGIFHVAALLVVTENGTVYASDAWGDPLAPIPPTWVKPAPSGNTYWLGTDQQGRDIFAQLLLGSRIALLVGFAAAFFSILIGVIVGVVAGYYGGSIDTFLMRFADVVLVLPFLPFIIILAALLGPNIWNIVLAIAAVGWPGTARVMRAETLSLKERPFIDSARVTGASHTRIMFIHITPNVMPLAFLFAMFSISGAILTEAALSFIGLGDPTTMSWGMMLHAIMSSASVLSAWWWMIPPGLCITLVSLGFFLIGRAFDEIVNPRLRRR